MKNITISPAWARFIGVVAMGAVWGALNAVVANITTSGVVSATAALVITGIIGVIEQQFSPKGTTAFGSITVA